MKKGDKVVCNFGVYAGRIGLITKMDAGHCSPSEIHIFVEFGYKEEGCYCENELKRIPT